MDKSQYPKWIIPAIVCSLIPAFLMFLILWVLPHSSENWLPKAMRGFTNIWFAGYTARENILLLSDFTAYQQFMIDILGKDIPKHVWGYPPSMLLIAVPVSWLPMTISFLTWTIAGLLFFIWTTYPRKDNPTVSRGGLSWGIVICCLFSPAIFENMLSGQTGALAAGLLVGGLLIYDSHPKSSGIMFGILAVKPQMGILLPLHLIACRKWYVVLWGAITFIIMFILSVVFFGLDSWTAFFTNTSKGMASVMSAPWEGGSAQLNFTSPFMAVRALGGSLSIAWTIQGIISFMCAGTCWVMSRRLMKNGVYPPKGSDTRMIAIALVIALDLLSVPYSHNYDMPAMAVAVALLFRHGFNSPSFPVLEKTLLGLAWFWPGIMVILPALFSGNQVIATLSPVLGSLSLVSVVCIALRRILKVRNFNG